MDVVLLKDVERLGSEGAVVKVKPGFARNFLVPRGLAAVATKETVSAVAEAARQRAKKSERLKGQADAVKRKLESHALTLTLSLGADDKPFGSVTAHEIAAALTRDGFSLEKHAVHLDQPIKALGAFEVPVRVHPDVTATLKLSIVKE
jgi:large subunit ribosomal protein L9